MPTMRHSQLSGRYLSLTHSIFSYLFEYLLCSWLYKFICWIFMQNYIKIILQLLPSKMCISSVNLNAFLLMSPEHRYVGFIENLASLSIRSYEHSHLYDSLHIFLKFISKVSNTLPRIYLKGHVPL